MISAPARLVNFFWDFWPQGGVWRLKRVKIFIVTSWWCWFCQKSFISVSKIVKYKYNIIVTFSSLTYWQWWTWYMFNIFKCSLSSLLSMCSTSLCFVLTCVCVSAPIAAVKKLCTIKERNGPFWSDNKGREDVFHLLRRPFYLFIVGMFCRSLVFLSLLVVSL